MLARKIGMLALLCRSRSAPATAATRTTTAAAAAAAFVFNLPFQHHHHYHRGVSAPPAGARTAAPPASHSSRRAHTTIPHIFHDICSRSNDNESHGRVPALPYLAGRHRSIFSPRKLAGAVEQGGGGRGMFSTTALHRGRRGGAGTGAGGGRGGRRTPDYGPARAGQHRSNVSPGTSVEVVQKHHQRTGELTPGTVSRLLTSSGFHPRGIKVMLAGGVVGRVQNIPGVDNTVSTAVAVPRSHDGSGYSSSSSSSSGSRSDTDAGDDNLAASRAIGNGQRRVLATAEGGGTPAAAAAAAATDAPVRSARPIRKFRAERVQGRSWSLEGGEVVARGAGGEEIPGAAGGGSSDFGGRRGRGRRGRGGRR